MKIFRFAKNVGRKMEQYDSKLVYYSQIAKTTTPSSIGTMYIEPDGKIGLHEAPSSQLFLIVQGDGWVRLQHDDKIKVQAGEGVFWDKGEWHESGSDTGMMCIIIQFDDFDGDSLNLLK